MEKQVTLTCQTEFWLLHAIKSPEKRFLNVLFSISTIQNIPNKCMIVQLLGQGIVFQYSTT